MKTLRCWYGTSQAVPVWFADCLVDDKAAIFGVDVPLRKYDRSGGMVRLTLTLSTREILGLGPDVDWAEFKCAAELAGLDTSTSQPLFGRDARPENVAMEAVIQAITVGFDADEVRVESATLAKCITTIARVPGPEIPVRDYDLIAAAVEGRRWKATASGVYRS